MFRFCLPRLADMVQIDGMEDDAGVVAMSPQERCPFLEYANTVDQHVVDVLAGLLEVAFERVVIGCVEHLDTEPLQVVRIASVVVQIPVAGEDCLDTQASQHAY